MKIHFWVGYPSLGEDFVEKLVVDRKNWNRQHLGIEIIFQKLYGYPYCEYWNFYNDGWNQMLIFMFFGCFSLFLTLFWVIFSPISAALDPLWACGWWIGSLRIITGYTPAYFGKKNYFQTQKTEFGHLLLKIHFWVGYPPLGDDFVEKWIVDKKNWNRQRLGIEKTFQNL